MPAASSEPDAATAALLDSLASLRRAVDAAHSRLPDLEAGPDGSPGVREARRRRLAWQLDEFLLPRVRDLAAPLVAVLIGSTGAGKSSLANALAGRVVSPSGVVRPTTLRPVVLLAASDVDAFLGGRLLAAMAERERLEVVVAEDAVGGLALVDAPDVDSVEAANREAADELLAAADLCVFVTTAQRYADAVPWAFLYRARERGVPLVVVVNRLPVPEADREAVMADCRRRFDEAGLTEGLGTGSALTFVPVVEGQREPAIDGLLPDAVAPLRRLLVAAAAGGPAASPVRRQALRGALAGLRGAVGEVAGDLEADERRAAALRAVVRRTYRAELDRLSERLASGVFLRGEVLRAWQDFVGAGDVARALATGIGRLRAWFAKRTGGSGAAVQLEAAKERAFAELVASLVAHAESAAHQVADDWAGDPVSAALLAGHPGLWGHGEQLPGRADAELHAWLGRLVEQVRERGHNRRAVAFAASVGVNAVGVAAMLAVFAHTAGLTLGEAAIAGGTAVVNQKLLEALFGDAAVASLVREAEADLQATLARILERDAERFTDLVAPPPVTPAELTGAALDVERAAARTLEGG